MTERVDTLVVGAGQAGIAASAHLTRLGVPHLVLERDRVAESWRSGRWDSLVMNGPAWHDRFPELIHEGDPEAFPGKEAVADYLVRFATEHDAPIRTGVTVTRVMPSPDVPGFHVATSAGEFVAQRIVVATGAFQRPEMPGIVPARDGLMQIHSAQYRNPDQLPAGGVLVVGAGSSGAQIADELVRAGRKVWLSVGAHGRPPRRYRGQDFVWWLGVLNLWDLEAAPGTAHVAIAVSGAEGGRTVDFRRMAAEGAVLVGRITGATDGVLDLSADLAKILAAGDADYLALLARADDFVAKNGLNLPEEPEAHLIPADPPCVTEPLQRLDLAAEGITSIIWATGYSRDYSWLKVDTFDAQGRPRHQRGVGAAPGIYFLGLPWQSRRGSSFIWGVWHDAAHVADHIARLRGYLARASH